MTVDRAACRRQGRTARERMSGSERWLASVQICRQITANPLYRSARTVALYFATPVEADVSNLFVQAFATGRRVFVPLLQGSEEMRFARLTPDSILLRNRFGIWEPDPRADRIPAQSLDLVIAPLVAFDDLGNRMGMGAGFYDRCFRFLRHREVWFHPKLLGAAFSCQQVERVPTATWDIPLCAVATEHGVSRFR